MPEALGEFDPQVNQSRALGQIEPHQANVFYFHQPSIGSYYYGDGHPMKPHRMSMTHALVTGYQLFTKMKVYVPHVATWDELLAYHDPEYIEFLEKTEEEGPMLNRIRRFNVGDAAECPVFPGLYDFQATCAGGSLDAAQALNHRQCEIAINWAGGMHHAKRSEASGFCYINDIVLGILELLKYHSRVMYIDIDVHHGDGVEEAFYLSHRVMTVSFHKFGDFFPGTGDVSNIGAGVGKYYSVNVPLCDGIRDQNFVPLFKAVVERCVERFRPEVIVLQCGADSVAGDRLGTFSLTSAGHGACVEFVKSFRLPLMLLGGGGYTMHNVARTWTYETAVAIGCHRQLPSTLPVTEYHEYFAPNHVLLPEMISTVEDRNSNKYLRVLTQHILENLACLSHAPSVQFSYAPPDFFNRDPAFPEDDTVLHNSVAWEGGGRAGSRLPRGKASAKFLQRKAEREAREREEKFAEEVRLAREASAREARARAEAGFGMAPVHIGPGSIAPVPGNVAPPKAVPGTAPPPKAVPKDAAPVKEVPAKGKGSRRGQSATRQSRRGQSATGGQSRRGQPSANVDTGNVETANDEPAIQ